MTTKTVASIKHESDMCLCHKCGRKLDGVQESKGSPNIGTCPKHFISYSDAYQKSRDYKIDKASCPECSNERAFTDEDGDTFCLDCNYDEYEDN